MEHIMESVREQLQIFVRRFGLLNASCCDECCGEQVSMAQSHILFEVRRRPGSPMQRIAEELGLDVTTFSRQVKALEGKGLVARRVSVDDRRVSLLDLTPAGTGVLAKIDTYMAERIGRIFARMSGFEQETVTRSLGLLNDALITSGQGNDRQEGMVACCK
jgi:DNA-binding MarR family transcriptional regulator